LVWPSRRESPELLVRDGRFATSGRTEPQLTLFRVDQTGDVAPPVVLHAVGFTDEQTQCDRCGREELRETVVQADDDGNFTARMGTTCAAKTLGARSPVTQQPPRENVRRSNLIRELREAENLIEDGRLACRAQRLGDARRLGRHRRDEVTATGHLEALVASGLAARPQHGV
jgi:hypothetical protein